MTAGRINSSLNLRHAPSPQCNLPGLWLCPPSPKDWQISQPNSNCSWKQSCSVHCARPPTTRTRRLVHRHTPICSSAQVAAPSSRPWWWALHRHPQKESPDSVKLDHMAQNDALPPQGTVDASGWLHNMRGDAMSMPGFGHLSDSVIVHTAPGGRSSRGPRSTTVGPRRPGVRVWIPAFLETTGGPRHIRDISGSRIPPEGLLWIPVTFPPNVGPGVQAGRAWIPAPRCATGPGHLRWVVKGRGARGAGSG